MLDTEVLIRSMGGGRLSFLSFFLSFYLDEIFGCSKSCALLEFSSMEFFSFFYFTVRNLTRNITYGIVTIVANWNAK